MNREEQGLDVEELNRELQQKLEELERPEDTGEHDGKRNHRKRSGKKARKKKKKIRPFHVLVAILCILVLLMASAAGAFFVLRAKGEKELKTDKAEEPITAPEEVQVEEEGKSVVYKGERYWYNENVINILCMGIDTSIQETGIDNIGENGQADALFLAVLDTETGKLSLVNISRDSMVDVNVYNVEGQYLRTETMQICLAYAYGDGKDQSCLNVAGSVSRLLYGMPIHAYAAIEYNGISALNDGIGGVTVQVLEDLTRSDPELTEGKTVTLMGQQAITYVRSRDTSVLESNNYRMARQRQYLLAFMKTALEQTRSDISVPLTLYQTASEYMITNIGPSEVTYLASKVLGTGFSEGDMHSIPGEVVMGEQYAEFYPDEEALYELILDVFYNKEN